MNFNFLIVSIFILVSSCTQFKRPTYTVAIIGDLENSLDPVLRTEVNSRTLLNQICGRLVKINENLELESFLAKKWNISDDGLIYEFQLHSDKLFSDKTPVDASDVKFSIERMRSIKESFASSLTRNIKKIEVPTKDIVRLTLSTPNVKFLYLLAHPRFCIMSAKKPFITLNDKIFPNSFSELSIVSWNEKTKTLTLNSERNSSNIDVMFLTQKEAISQFNNNKIDDLSFYLLTDDEINALKAPKKVIETKYYWTWVFDFNLHSRNSGSLDFRKKFIETFDKFEFVKDWNSNIQTSETIIPTGFLPNFKIEYTRPPQKYRHFSKCTQFLTIGVITGIPSPVTFEEAIKKQVQKITGCSPQITWIPMSDFSKVSSERRFDMYFSAVSNRLIDPIEYFRSYISDNSENLLGCSDSSLDKLFKVLEKKQVHSRSLSDYEDIEKTFHKSYCAMPIGNPKFKFVYSSRVNKIFNNPIGMDLNFWTANISNGNF